MYMKVQNYFNNSLVLGNDSKKDVVLGTTLAVLGLSANSFAAGGTGSDMKSIINKFLKQFSALRKQLVFLSTGLAALLCVVCGVMMMLSKDDKKVGAAKGWLIRILSIYVFILAVTVVISLVGDFGQGLGDGDKMSGDGSSWK